MQFDAVACYLEFTSSAVKLGFLISCQFHTFFAFSRPTEPPGISNSCAFTCDPLHLIVCSSSFFVCLLALLHSVCLCSAQSYLTVPFCADVGVGIVSL